MSVIEQGPGQWVLTIRRSTISSNRTPVKRCISEKNGFALNSGILIRGGVGLPCKSSGGQKAIGSHWIRPDFHVDRDLQDLRQPEAALIILEAVSKSRLTPNGGVAGFFKMPTYN